MCPSWFWAVGPASLPTSTPSKPSSAGLSWVQGKGSRFLPAEIKGWFRELAVSPVAGKMRPEVGWDLWMPCPLMDTSNCAPHLINSASEEPRSAVGIKTSCNYFLADLITVPR
jgi:hypothetical protein